jgi:hypothetical protein
MNEDGRGMAAAAIPPIGTWPTAFTDRSAEQAAAFLALAAGYPERTFVVGENFFYRNDLRYARAVLDDGGRSIAAACTTSPRSGCSFAA